MEWKLTEGDSAPKIIMVEQGALMLLLLLCGKKNISAHVQSVGSNCMLARTSMFTASDYSARLPAICPAYRSSF